MSRFNGGRGWEYDECGRIVLERETKPARTQGKPVTMRGIHDDFGSAITEAHEMLGVSRATIMAVIALESVRLPGTHHRDPKSYRYEERIDDYSAGLMQTLSKTATAMRHRYALPVPKITRVSLYDPRTSILCGTAYLVRLSERWETTDGMLLQAAYNAGGVYESSKNEWRLRTYSPDRTERFAQWHNDALEVLG
jgi:peptidoglycan LD-endopeptidase CwlK